jgi:stage III sporulation protein AH
MMKILSSIGKKNIIIISGILLIGVAVYLNLTLDFTEDTYNLENDYGDFDNSKVLGQAALVDNLNPMDGGGYIDDAALNEDMGIGGGGGALENTVDTGAEVSAGEDGENYFAVSAVSRQRARDESIELLTDIANSAEALPDVRDKALSDIAVIAQEIEKEANIETLVKAKGFEECVAVVSGENANIIVKTEGLMQNEVAQIKEIVYEQAGISPGNVKIMERS